MKTGLFLLGMLFVGVAQAQNPLLTYRGGDPFLFCTEGQDPQKKGDRCWWPLPPYTGGAAWMNAPWCEPVDPYGKPWDNDDYASFAQYQSVCPIAQTSGGWDNKAGQRNMVPYEH